MNCTHMSTTRQGSTPLHQSALSGNYTMTQMLLGAGANIHAMDIEGDTPLHQSADQGLVEVSQMLVGAGANVHATNNEVRLLCSLFL